MTEPPPKVTHDNCVALANHCCAYYRNTIQTYDKHDDPYWIHMRDVSDRWRELLVKDTQSKTELTAFRAMVARQWNYEDCGTVWIELATGIDLWLRSVGADGLGPNPWYKDQVPNDVWGPKLAE